MAILVFCSGCQKQLNVDDRFAGKKVKCKRCGGILAVPATTTARSARPAPPPAVPRPVAANPRAAAPPPPPPPREELDDGPSLDDLENLPQPEVAPVVVPARPQVYRPSKAARVAKSLASETLGAGKKLAAKVISGGVVIVLLLSVAAKIYRGYTRISGHNPLAEVVDAATETKPADSVTLPQRPGLRSEGIGIVSGQVQFTNRVGSSLTVKVYLPEGQYPNKSLPAVMMAPAGTLCITGIAMTPEYTPEHLLYVRDGFAVIAYSLSGPFSGDPNENRRGLTKSAQEFHAAGGGLIDAQDALSFALARFPEINPEYVLAAGFSSAGTHALMLSYKEPRIKGVAAYSPALNLKDRFGSDVSVLRRDLPRIATWLDEYSADRLGAPRCPIMIFHARDDDNTPFSDSQNYANQYPGQITLVAVNRGGHGDALMSQGIPAGIRFFRSNIAGLPPKASPQPNRPAGIFPAVAADNTATPAGNTKVPPLPPAPAERIRSGINGNTITYDGATIKLQPPAGMRMMGINTKDNRVELILRNQQSIVTVTVTRAFGGNGQWATYEGEPPKGPTHLPPGCRFIYDRLGNGVHIRMEAIARERSQSMIAALEAMRDATQVSR